MFGHPSSDLPNPKNVQWRARNDEPPSRACQFRRITGPEPLLYNSRFSLNLPCDRRSSIMASISSREIGRGVGGRPSSSAAVNLPHNGQYSRLSWSSRAGKLFPCYKQSDCITRKIHRSAAESFEVIARLRMMLKVQAAVTVFRDKSHGVYSGGSGGQGNR